MTADSKFPFIRDLMEVVGKTTVGEKYQMTLPKFVRKFLRADNGDLIVFIKDHDKILVKRRPVNPTHTPSRFQHLRITR